MNWYRHTGNIKTSLLILGICLIASLLIYTQTLVNKLREDNREIVKFYAELIAKAAITQSDENLDFIFENIIKKVQFPIIQTDSQGKPQSWRNLPDNVKTAEEAKSIMKTMDKQNEPIPLLYSNPETGKEILFGVLHYGDSKLIQRLIWLPYFEIGAIALFIFLGFTGFTIIRNSEKRHIWVGMARETAHQLGTPVSALMGWVDWLKSHPEKSKDIVEEMETDLKRLEQVGNRFSKMGSETDLKEVNLSELIETIVVYLKRRLPSVGKNFMLTNKITDVVTIKANETLLSWAIENVIRNGIDSIENNSGRIQIQLKQNPDSVKIYIKDNGRGIPKKDWKNVFRPGFSTKQRGWGLGLSLARRIVNDIHHGNIVILESSPGIGTQFEITLPR